MLPTVFVFREAYGPYRAGQKILAGRGQTMGGGVADALLRRKVLELVPGEPEETEPRPTKKAQRGG